MNIILMFYKAIWRYINDKLNSKNTSKGNSDLKIKDNKYPIKSYLQLFLEGFWQIHKIW